MEEIVKMLPQEYQQEFKQCFLSIQESCRNIKSNPDQRFCEQQLVFHEEMLNKMSKIWQHRKIGF